jgi:hypothetical protein
VSNEFENKINLKELYDKNANLFRRIWGDDIQRRDVIDFTDLAFYDTQSEEWTSVLEGIAGLSELNNVEAMIVIKVKGDWRKRYIPVAIQFNGSLENFMQLFKETGEYASFILGGFGFTKYQNIIFSDYCSADRIFIGDVQYSEDTYAYYSGDGSILIRLPWSCEDKYEIPNGVTTIGSFAFYNRRDVYSVIIPSGVKKISSNAFRKCEFLQSVEIPESVSSICYGAFYECYRLSSIKIPDGVKEIAPITFFKCKDLESVEIPESVTSIGYSAFQQCGNLTSIIIPSKVEEIGHSAFCGCAIESIVIPNGVKVIKDRTFGRCFNLKSITIPDSVTNIEGSVFEGCDSLQSIDILPSTITAIERYMFNACFGLTSIIIPSNITEIKYAAFKQCDELVSVVIPSSVTNIEDNVFSLCAKLANITVAEDNPCYKSIDGNLYAKDGTKLIQYALGKEETSFSIPDGVVTLAGGSFWISKNLNNVQIPNTVEKIGDYAFDCNELKEVIIPKSVNRIGTSAFGYSYTLQKAYYEGTKSEWKNKFGNENPFSGSPTTLYYYSETEPKINSKGTAYVGNHWRYVDGVATVWEKTK